MKTVTTVLIASLTALFLTAATPTYPAAESGLQATQIESAKTPAEHEAVATLFENEAASLTRKSEMHDGMAKTYSVPGGKPAIAALARHCAAVAKDYKAAAKQNLELAAIHRQLAKDGAK